jgi:predicted double-glycine peptidase
MSAINNSTLKEHPIISNVKHFIRVPIVSQDTDYTCGVAALQSILYYWDANYDYYATTLSFRLQANVNDGVLVDQMVHFARRRGYQAYRKEWMKFEELKDLILEGKPVIVLLQAWRSSLKVKWTAWEDGHFSVVIGFDAENVYLMDPSTLGNYTYIPINEFMDRWHDRDGRDKVSHLGLAIWKGRPCFDDRIAIRMK